MLHRIIRSWMRSIHYLLVIAFSFSSVAPLQAQPLRQRSVNPKRAARSAAIVGGMRYGIDWVNRQIESVRLPVWAKRRIVATLKVFKTPTEQEQAVIEKYSAGRRLNAAEKRIWNQYKNRVYTSRGALTVIVTVILAILATIGGASYLSQRDVADVPAGAGALAGTRDSQGRLVRLGDTVFFARHNWKVIAIDDRDKNLRLRAIAGSEVVRAPSRLTTIVSEPSTLWEMPLEEAGYEVSSASELTTAQIDPETAARYEEAELQAAAQREQEQLRIEELRRQAEAEQEAAEAARLAALPAPSGQTFEEWRAAQVRAGQERRARRQAVAPEPATIPLPEQTLEEHAQRAGLTESPEQTIERLRQKRESEDLNWAEQLMLEHSVRQVAEAGAASAQGASSPIVLTPVPVEQAAAVYTDPIRVRGFMGQPLLMSSLQEVPESLTRAYTEDQLDAEFARLARELAQVAREAELREASEKSAREYQEKMEQWGNRWQSMKRAGRLIDNERGVFRVFTLLMMEDIAPVQAEIMQALRRLSPNDVAFLEEFIQPSQPLSRKFDAIKRGIQGRRQVQRMRSGASAAAEQPQDQGLIASVLDSMVSLVRRGGDAGASAAAASSESAPALITQWGRLKAAIDRYLRAARKNIIAGKSTEFAEMHQLQQFIGALSNASLKNPAARQRIATDLEGFIGSGRELQSLMTHVMRTGGGEEITPESLEAVVKANFQAIPEVFKQAPIYLSPETMYTFLNIPMNTQAKNMRAIILAKIAALERMGYQKNDLNWLQRQLLFYADPYEKDRLDAYLGDEEALQRLQEQAKVRFSDREKDAQGDTVLQLIELLEKIQSQLQRS